MSKESVSASNKMVAIMGGTFNPIHNGHLRVAVEVADLLNLDQLKLVPCFRPAHKAISGISTAQRLKMLGLAVASDIRLAVDNREIKRAEPSFTIDTLKELRSEVGEDTSIVMVVGMDSFCTLPSWKSWLDLTSYVHIVVVSRLGSTPFFTDELKNYYEKYRASTVAELQCAPSGRIWLETLALLDISSSMIRELRAKNKSIAYLLPDSVQNYIDTNKLYL
ncbi:nicotinate-nucleotide adenylyltransferase [Marinomonas sp. 2405UD68-3]|uniref:nicotinate-nucleotide adenylyltransferase n=1 Tax=Marinomonas sp. 2405UD68-3 TaxID=3391835 RepID=UPI0039C94453